jgi:hypothetical protein
MPCCSSPGPAYKQRVDLVFSSSSSTAQTAALSAAIDAAAVTKLLYYANVNSDKLPQIARELERRIAKELGKKHFALAVCGAFALSELLKSCHRDLRLFYPHVAATIKSLLTCAASREIQLVGVDLFATFAALPTRVLPPPSDADAFVRDFVRMASTSPSSSSSSSPSPPPAADAAAAAEFHETPTTARHARVAGLRGIRAYLPLLDELPSRLNDDALRILPSIFDNFRLTGPAASGPVPRTPLSPEQQNKDDDNDDDDDDEDNDNDKKKPANKEKDESGDPDDDDASPSVRSLARQCLRELVLRTSTTNVKSLVEAALEYVDSNGLWSVDAGGEFPRELFATICGTLKPHDYQTALDSLLAKIAAVPDTAHKTRVVETLRHCLRSGMLTVHQLVRLLLQQLVDSLKAAFGTKDAAVTAAHAELHRALLACVVELGRVVEQPKRLDILSGIVRQLKALEGVFSKAPQRAAGHALLVRAFADVAAHLKPLAAADTVQLASAYDTLFVVAAAPASGDERAALALATIDALRALVAAAPPRTDDDDDRDGHRFATTSAAAGGAGATLALSTGAGSAVGGAGGAAPGSGTNSGTGSTVEGSPAGAAELTKRGARTRRGTGGPRDLGVHAASAYVEKHAHVLSALDTFLFPDEACGAAALSVLVAAGGSLLLTALSVYGVGEALRTLPFIFALQQRAVDLPDTGSGAAPATKKSRKASVAAAVGIEVAAPINDPSAVHVLVGAYMAALAEQLDSDELRATVTHTLSQRSKKKQRSVYVAANGARELTFSESGATKKALAAAKRITTTFERAGVVSVLLRDKLLQKFEALSARLALEWQRTGAVNKFPASSRLNRLGSVQQTASTRGALHATESDRDVRAGGVVPAGTEEARAALASYPHNAPTAVASAAKRLADANIDVGGFLAVLRGDAVVNDDDEVLGNASDDDDSLHRSGTHDSDQVAADDDDNDDDGDAMMQVSDSDAPSEISIDEDVDDAATTTKKKTKKTSKKSGATKKSKGKKGGKTKKRAGGKKRDAALKDSRAKPAPPAPGSEQWREQVQRLRERSFEEVSAVSARAQERAVRETALAAFGFDCDTFEDDELADPLPTHHNWHVATTLPSLLGKLDAEFQGDTLPHLRDEFAVGALVVH